MTNKLYFIFLYAIVLLLTLIITMNDAVAGEEKYGKLIREAALEHGIDPDLALAIAEVESKFNPNAVGALGEIGIFQLRPEFHAVTAGDVRGNARTAMAYLNTIRRPCAHKYGDGFWVCYNRGPNSKKVEKIETLPYYKKVKAAYNARKAKHAYVGQ